MVPTMNGPGRVIIYIFLDMMSSMRQVCVKFPL
ncbi:unnamed protein product [Onchocerca flexuosa]|uniref:Uncharacterized protein n=1 Tax=Onchocerca flexuosa TaxID=387005 RepID=A0A183I6F1_9BILA|nr:unnamed protein product [Onchocerca flexuosa]